MLSYSDRLSVLEFTAFRDDELPHRFYVLPSSPRIALSPNGRPLLSYLHYALDDGTGDSSGFFQAKAVLSLTAEDRARVQDELRRRLQSDQAAGLAPNGHPITTTEPMLAAIPWTDLSGSIEVFTDEDGQPVRSEPVVGMPSATDDLSVALAFSIQGVASQAFAEWFAPPPGVATTPIFYINLHYGFSYLARAPAVTLTATSKRTTLLERVAGAAQLYEYVPASRRYHKRPRPASLPEGSLQASLLGRGWMFAIPKTRLKEVLHLAFEIQLDVGEAGSGEGGEALREAATNAAVTLLQSQLGKEGLLDKPLSADQTDEGEDVHPVKEQPTLPEETTLRFQSTDLLVIPDARNEPLSTGFSAEVLRGCYRRISPTNPYFQDFPLDVVADGVDFDQDGIQAIQVHLKYDEADELQPTPVPPIRTVTLRPGHTTESRSWPLSRDALGVFKLRYRYRTTVQYDGSLGVVEGTWITQTDGNNSLLINPAGLGAVRAELSFFPTHPLVPAVEVELACTGPSGERLSATRTLTTEVRQGRWFQYVGGLDRVGPVPWTYRPTWTIDGVGRVVGEEVAGRSDGQNILSKPFTMWLTYLLSPQGWEADTVSISGELSYEDTRNGYRVFKTFTFPSAVAPTVSILVDALSGGPEVASVHWRRLSKDNSLREGRATVRQGSVSVGPRTAAPLDLLIIPLATLDWDHDIELILVNIRYTDPSSPAPWTKTLQIGRMLRNADVPIPVSVPRSDPTLGSFDLTVDYIARDRSRSSRVSEVGRTDITILLDRPVVPTPAGPGA